MLSLRRLLPVSFLLLTLVTSSAIAQTPDDSKAQSEPQSDLEEFERLLDQVDAPALHAALHDHSPKKFTHGMFEKDRTAAEALHREDASIASSIVALAKRQDISNGTTTTSAAPIVPGSSSTSEVPDSASATTQVTPVAPIATATSTNPDGTPATGSSVAPGSSPNAPTTVQSTSTSPSAPEASTSAGAIPSGSSAGASTTPAADTGTLTAGEIATFTNVGGAIVTGTLSSGQVITSINAQGVTIVTTVGGGSRTVAPQGSNSGSNSATTTGNAQLQTTTSRRTTTLPDGSQSTVTAVTVVAAGGVDSSVPSGTAGVGASSGTPASSPGLQTGFAPKTMGFGREMLAVVGGAVGVAMMM